jgi:hypothetical protein
VVSLGATREGKKGKAKVEAAQLGFRPPGHLEEATQGERNGSSHAFCTSMYHYLDFPTFIAIHYYFMHIEHFMSHLVFVYFHFLHER